MELLQRKELETTVTRCIVQCKDSPVYHHTAWVGSWQYDHLTYVLQNDSICERVCPWRLDRTR